METKKVADVFLIEEKDKVLLLNKIKEKMHVFMGNVTLHYNPIVYKNENNEDCVLYTCLVVCYED